MTYDVGNPSYGKEDAVLEAARRHVRSFEPGTLIGSELNLAHHLRDLDGDIWAPWCEPGEVELEEDEDFSVVGAVAFIAVLTMVFTSSWPMFLCAGGVGVACAAIYSWRKIRT